VAETAGLVAETVALKATAVAQWAVNSAMNASIAGLVLVGIIALTIGVIKLTEEYNNNQEAAKKVIEENEILIKEHQVLKQTLQTIDAEANKSYTNQLLNLNKLRKATDDNTLSMNERKEALKRIIALDPEHLKGLTLAEASYSNTSKKVGEYIVRLGKLAEAKAIEKELENNIIKLYENEGKVAKISGDIQFYTLMRIDAAKKLQEATNPNDRLLQRDALFDYSNKVNESIAKLPSLASEQRGLETTINSLNNKYGELLPTLNSVELADNKQSESTKK
ncbi:hypothetical protein HXX01_04330, partial [Candidatus Nomurabacteria bacterium]|nr:hypothetical protein [Candidatus Nomurabacteria bacterium]